MELQHGFMQVVSIECSKNALAMLYDELFRRAAPAIPDDLGALLKYRVIMIEAGEDHEIRHAYLFETAVVVVGNAGSGFIPFSMNTKLDHALELIHLIYFEDVTAMVPTRMIGAGQEYIYGLTLETSRDGSDLY